MIRSFKKVVTALLVVFLITLAIPAVSFAGNTGGKLVAQYKFDGDFKDSSGNGNDGTASGDVTFADDGVAGKSAVFNGGFVKLAESPTLNLGKKFTISAWVKLDPGEAQQNNENTIIAKVNKNDRATYFDDYMYIAYLQGVHDASLGLSQLHNGYSPGVGSSGVGSLGLSEKWSMITFVNDGENLYLYVDGKVNAIDKTGAEDPDAPFDDSVAAGMFIGGSSGLGLFKGKMDDLRLYNYALSSDEIKKLYDYKGYTNQIVLQIGKANMTVDGAQQEIDPGKGTSPVVINGRTMVPIRAVIEAMGGTVEWVAAEQRIDIKLAADDAPADRVADDAPADRVADDAPADRVADDAPTDRMPGDGLNLQLWVNKTAADLNGNQLKMDVPPTVVNGRTLVPLRFVSENLGCRVDWDRSTHKITISYASQD